MNPGSAKTDFYTTFISGVFFPLHELIKKHDTVAIRKEMEASQWWDEGRLEHLRLSRLRRLLASAGARVPYYRSLFADIGFKVEDVASLADLARLPLLDKSTIRANSDALKAENATGLARFNSPGSSGARPRRRKRATHRQPSASTVNPSGEAGAVGDREGRPAPGQGAVAVVEDVDLRVGVST